MLQYRGGEKKGTRENNIRCGSLWVTTHVVLLDLLPHFCIGHFYWEEKIPIFRFASFFPLFIPSHVHNPLSFVIFCCSSGLQQISNNNNTKKEERKRKVPFHSLCGGSLIFHPFSMAEWMSINLIIIQYILPLRSAQRTKAGTGL